MSPESANRALDLATRAVRGQLTADERGQSYGARSAAIRAARKALGNDAKPGEQFDVAEKEGRFTWTEKRSFAAPKPSPKGKRKWSGIAKPETVEAAPKVGKRAAAKAEAEANARAGKLPAKPDLSAPTHAGYRKRFEAICKMVEEGDLKGLKADETPYKGSTRAMIARYRDLAILALEARKG